MTFRRYTWPVLAILGLISLPLSAEQPEPTHASGVQALQAETNAAETGVGLQAFIDDKTGEVRAPTEAEMAQMAEQFRRRYIDLSVESPIVYHADGSMSKELGTKHRMYSVARVTSDGEVETDCLPAEQAADFLANDETVEPEIEVGIDGESSQ